MKRSDELATLTLAGALAATALLCAVPSRAAGPPSASGLDPLSTGQVAPLNADTLMLLFLSSHPDLRTDPAFARDWTAVTKCQAWSRIANDEFRAAPFMRAGAAELASGAGIPVPSSFQLRLDRDIGRYDTGKQEFGLSTLPNDAVLPIRIDDFKGEGQATQFRYGCAPTGGSYPVEFTVTFDNLQVANGLPMAPAAAEAFALARAYPNGSRNTHVVVDLRLRLTMGQSHPAVATMVAKGVVVPVTAHIDDVTVEDGTPQRKILYHLTEEKRGAGEAASREARERARAEAMVKRLDGPAMTAQFDMERAGPVVGPDLYRIRMQVQWTRQDGPNGPEFRLPLAPTPYQLGLGVMLRFDNAAEVAALAPDARLQPLLQQNPIRSVSLTYVPVGATDDPFRGGRVVVGHVVSVDTDASDGVGGFVSVRPTSAPVPWKAPEPDGRQAAAFDVVGIRTGMTPDEVVAAASSELGQKLSFDEVRGEVRSAAADCDFDYRRGKPPPLGRRCLLATFARAGTGAPWLLARLRLTQTLATDQEPVVFKAIVAKYGQAALQAPWQPPATLADGEGTEPPRGSVGGWGARLSDVRLEPDHVPLPVYAFEAKSRAAGGVTILTLTALDLAASKAAKDAADAEAKRAGAAVPTKF